MSVTIAIENPMLTALREGTSGYQPVLEGESLGLEYAWPEASFANLMKLIEKNKRRVCSFIAGPGGILVVFSSGENYLATGFAVGKRELEDGTERFGLSTRLFAKFAENAGLGEYEDWLLCLGRLPEDWCDEIRFVKREPVAVPPKIFAN